MKEDKSYCVTSYGDYAEGLGTLRASGGDIGGGSEVLVVAYGFKHKQGTGGLGFEKETAPTLSICQDGGGVLIMSNVDVLPFDTTQVTSPGNWSKPEWGGAMPSSRSRTTSPSGSDKDDRK